MTTRQRPDGPPARRPGAAPRLGTKREAGPAAGSPRQGAAGPAPAPRPASVRPDRVYLGWQYALQHPDPGPAPRRPAPPVGVQLDQGWVTAQRREEDRLSRPAKITTVSTAALGCAVLALGITGLLNPWLTGLGLAASLAAAGACGRAVRRGAQDLRSRIAAEQDRLAKIKAVQQDRLAARQELHARQFRAWQARQAAFDRQAQWYSVSLPAEIDRVDVAGGTLAGWSALLTMIAVPRLGAGGEVTVLDLTEGAVATDLLAVARRSGIQPLVWVMPGDLPRLDLGTGLGRDAFADLLSATVTASREPGAAGDPAQDVAILDRVLQVLGGEPTIARVTAALRVLAQVGDPRADLRTGLLSPAQLEQITAMFGRSAADRVVIDRAWALESRLRQLDQLGSAAVPLPPSRLRVAWLDRRSGAMGNKVLGTYMTVALAHMLRQAPAATAARRWQRTLCVLGAERLAVEVLDRLCDACEISGTGLVMAYRSLPGHVTQRLGRGNAAVAFMRLGNAQEAKAASEQIGTGHRFVLSQLTDTVGASLTDTGGDSYTSTIGTADSLADSVSVNESSGRSQSRGRSRAGGAGPFGNFTGSASRDTSHSAGTSDSRSLTAGINASTSWGLSTSTAVSASASLTRTSQRSREFLVEQHELQQLPPSALIVSYGSAAGRQVVLADANPGIFGLRSASLLSLDEARGAVGGTAVGEGPGPNLGPPPERLDWRTPRR
jgi:hypothetical protein